MIWWRLGLVIAWLLRMLWPHRPPVARINLKSPCPACGHVGSDIQFMRVEHLGSRLRRECWTCKCKWYEEPVSVAKEPAI